MMPYDALQGTKSSGVDTLVAAKDRGKALAAMADSLTVLLTKLQVFWTLHKEPE